jgi:hypothetical protein
MVNEEIQKQCETLEDLLNYECKQPRLKQKEFNAINHLLFELQTMGLYKVPERYLNGEIEY